MAPGELCTYGSNECSCVNQMGMPQWTCHTCPASQPPDGQKCNDGGAKCVYGGSECACTQGAWNCGTCPAAEPLNDASCNGLEGLACPYAGTNCVCRAATSSWRCVDPCPPSQPAPGDSCQTGLQFCTYGNTACICIQGGFFCN